MAKAHCSLEAAVKNGHYWTEFPADLKFIRCWRNDRANDLDFFNRKSRKQALLVIGEPQPISIPNSVLRIRRVFHNGQVEELETERLLSLDNGVKFKL